MERKTVSEMMLTLLLTSTLALSLNIHSVRASVTIYINADGSVTPVGAPIVTSDGIMYTFTGDVSYPTYSGIVVRRSNIVIDGEGYAVIGGGSGVGLNLATQNSVTIKNINVKSFDTGIYLAASFSNNVVENNVTNNDNGIYIGGKDHDNTISGNNITANHASNVRGIYLGPFTDHNSISGNNMTAINGFAILLGPGSDYNTISGNNIVDNGSGIYLNASSSNSISGNNVTSNNDWGISLYYSSNDNNISGNYVKASALHGIELYSSSSNTISGNYITANDLAGIGVGPSSAYNNISGNDITANNKHGIELYSSSSSTISGNNITANSADGINVYSSSGNNIYHNNFIGNQRQAYSQLSTNAWDNGYPSGGNYWSDYITQNPSAQELDDSGIWDTPYVIEINNRDRYPLMERFRVLAITASAGSGGTISPSGSMIVNYGDDVTFTITPNPHYHILSVWVDMVYVGAVPSYTFTHVHSDHSIAAYFAIDQFAITASAGIGGTISPSGSVTVNYGDDITYAITADPYYGILDVVVDGTDHRGGIPSYTFHDVAADHSITASFAISDHDVAVIDVTPSRTSVGTGCTVQVDVTVENHGFFTESFNLTVYYGNSAITVDQWEAFWRMGDVNRDGYINMIDMNLLSAAFMATPGDPNWNPWADLNQDLVINISDISICAWNNGLEIWTHFISGGVIGTLPVINLAAGNTQTLTFTWGTLGMPYGNYVICGYAVPILGKEVDRIDNTLGDGTVTVTIAGDIDGDHNVDYDDFIILAGAYGSSTGQPAYNPQADIDGDGDVDYSDFIALAGNYGQHWP